jgi:hypothetical protein
MADITKADVEAIRLGWKLRASGTKGGRVGPDRGLKRLRHLFNWAIEAGIITSTPFKIGDKVVVHIAREKGRIRRLEAGEEQMLLKVADPWLQALIVAPASRCTPNGRPRSSASQTAHKRVSDIASTMKV